MKKVGCLYIALGGSHYWAVLEAQLLDGQKLHHITFALHIANLYCTTFMLSLMVESPFAMKILFSYGTWIQLDLTF